MIILDAGIFDRIFRTTAYGIPEVFTGRTVLALASIAETN